MKTTKTILNYYSVNNLGHVFNKAGKQIKGTKTSKGYYQTTQANKKKLLIHRIVALAWVPNPENKPHVNHINGDKSDNRPENLEWCTPTENNRHAVQIGLHRCRQIQVESYHIPTKTIIIYNSIVEASRGSGVNKKTLGSGLKRKHPYPYISKNYKFKTIF